MSGVVMKSKNFLQSNRCVNEDGAQPLIVELSNVKPQSIEWFWYNRIPSGMLTLILGDPGLGKSFLTLYLAAKVSRGGTWPDSDGIADNCAPIGSVVLLTAEDNLSCVVRPRLDNMKADIEKIIAIEGVRIKDENDREQYGHFDLQRDLPALKKAVRYYKDTRLVIIDPLSAYLGVKIDSYKDTQVRSVLAPLVELAEKSDVTIIGVMHLNKSYNSKAIYRGLGSIGFTAAARTVWLVSTDPDNHKSKRRLLLPVKYNMLIDPTGLAFLIKDNKVVFEKEPVNITANEALGRGSTIDAPKLNEAVKWLVNQLQAGKPIKSNKLKRMAKKNGITFATLRAAKDELGVVSYPIRQGNTNVWYVKLPKISPYYK